MRLTANFPHMLEEQARHITEVIQARESARGAMQSNPRRRPKPNGWRRSSKRRCTISDFLQQCTPGYYNNEGKPAESTGLFGEQYGGGPVEFHDIIRNWRADGQMKGLKLT